MSVMLLGRRAATRLLASSHPISPPMSSPSLWLCTARVWLFVSVIVHRLTVIYVVDAVARWGRYFIGNHVQLYCVIPASFMQRKCHRVADHLLTRQPILHTVWVGQRYGPKYRCVPSYSTLNVSTAILYCTSSRMCCQCSVANTSVMCCAVAGGSWVMLVRYAKYWLQLTSTCLHQCKCWGHEWCHCVISMIRYRPKFAIVHVLTDVIENKRAEMHSSTETKHQCWTLLLSSDICQHSRKNPCGIHQLVKQTCWNQSKSSSCVHCCRTPR